MQLRSGKQVLDLSQPRVMGVLNCTPDSFSDGGLYTDLDTALRQALRMCAEGAVIIDVGGESTRPGAAAVSVELELDRVIPLIERLSSESEVLISIDTGKPEVMRAAISAGATMINDVYALRLPGALQAARTCGAPVCLMHMQGEPRSMQQDPRYTDVVVEVRQFLQERIRVCESGGIPREHLLIDPGFGFGKTLNHNLDLLRHLDVFASLGLPLVVGLSRKSMIGTLLGNVPVTERLQGSVTAAVVAAMHGANIIRAHDVQATVAALKFVTAVYGHG